jgi:UDP-4-amino-4,6-dideoxy-N-acetyl-beta-L-altrosamine N-acetyltransferase
MYEKIECENGIVLRPICESDTELVLKWRNAAIVRDFFIYQKEITREEHLNWLKTKVATGKVVQFVMVDEKNKKPFGSVYLKDINWIHKKAEYGIFIGETEYMGKGMGSKIAKKMLQYAFEKMKLHRVYLRVFEENVRARKSYENAGFVEEALLHDDVFVNGEYKNIVLMGAINKEDKE